VAVEKPWRRPRMERSSCCAQRLTQSDLTRLKRSFQRRTSFLFLLALLLLSTLRLVVNALVEACPNTHPDRTAFLMQNVLIADLLERISSGRLLIPSVEGLSGSGEARILPEMSELELSNLMINSNRIAAVLVHLQGVVEDLHQAQFNKWTRRLSERGELGDAEAVANQVAEMTLDEELEDFGELDEYRREMGWK